MLPLQNFANSFGKPPTSLAKSMHQHLAGSTRCAPEAPQAHPGSVPRRAKLSDLDTNFHCSIIGTCLPTTELRRVIPRYAPELDRQRASDLEIHHAAVELCYSPGAVVKEINKALDTRHALAIKQFKGAADDRQLRQLWADALASGHVPGAYWALMTHPQVSRALRVLAFGDVHMLSHMVGASNRADIRRLATLENERKTMLELEQQQQARIHDLQAQLAQQCTFSGELEQRIFTLSNQCEQQQQQRAPSELLARMDQLAQQLSLQISLRDRAERLMQQQLQDQLTLNDELNSARGALAASAGELRALEHSLMRSIQANSAEAAQRRLDGVRIAYVGGRPGTVAVLRQLVGAMGGELLAHDGGIGDRLGALESVLKRADLVVFPVDCISHGAMHAIKRLCARQGISYVPVRCASVGSFVALLEDRALANDVA